MRDIAEVSTHAKVFYTPLEAAVRWSGLMEHERKILQASRGCTRLPSRQRSRWPHLHLNLERIYDGLVNGDLPFGRAGVTSNDSALLSSAELTVRHVDLRAWMLDSYPDHRPNFLFDSFDRSLPPVISADLVQTLLLEHELLRVAYARADRCLKELQATHEALEDRYARVIERSQDTEITPRADATYLNIIGAMLHLMLAKSPSGLPYSTFRSQEAIITALMAHHSTLMGVAERTLQLKFAQAKRHVAARIA